MRALATMQKIDGLDPIDGADRIEVATVRGWKIVVKKGDFAVGDLCVYYEIDSFLPVEPQYEFLRKSCFRSTTWDGDGFRLRTIKLRGQISQGLVLPIKEVVPNIQFTSWTVGDDMTSALGVRKWDPPLPAQLRGKVKGNFPTDLFPKTDQERIQNCFNDVVEDDTSWETTLKLDGSSCTIFKLDSEVRVCSRNLELKMDDGDNTFVKMAHQIAPKLASAEGYAFQGELMGPGIQGNREKLREHGFYVFAIYDIFRKQYLTPRERHLICTKLGLTEVPTVHADVDIRDIQDVETFLSLADRPSINHPIAEGLVFNSHNIPHRSFKTISNRFLLKEKD